VTTKAILNERFWIPLNDVTRKRAEDLYQQKVYDDKQCDRCEYRPERHCELCDECPAYQGEIKLWRTVEKGDTTWIGVPRGNRAKLKTFVGKKKVKIVDKRSRKRMKFPLKFTGQLRPHQKTPIAEMLEAGYGVLKAPPRAGKTVMAVKLACALGYKTLILAAQQEWLDEFYRTFVGNDTEKPMSNAPDIEQFESTAIIKNSCKTVADFKNHDVCLATYQTFITPGGRKKLKEIKSEFGLIIIDEVHFGAATEFAKVLLGLNARHMIGLTGTDDRKDGLYCQPAGTMVRTASGEKAIETFSVGDEVLSFDHGAILPVVSTVTNTIKRPAEILYEITHEHGTLRCTADHQLWSVTRQSYVKACELKDTDVLLAIENPSL
jgi:hypothetical protein